MRHGVVSVTVDGSESAAPAILLATSPVQADAAKKPKATRMERRFMLNTSCGSANGLHQWRTAVVQARCGEPQDKNARWRPHCEGTTSMFTSVRVHGGAHRRAQARLRKML